MVPAGVGVVLCLNSATIGWLVPDNGGGTGYQARQTWLAHGHAGDLVKDGGDAGGLVEKLGRARPVAVEVGKGFHPDVKGHGGGGRYLDAHQGS